MSLAVSSRDWPPRDNDRAWYQAHKVSKPDTSQGERRAIRLLSIKTPSGSTDFGRSGPGIAQQSRRWKFTGDEKAIVLLDHQKLVAAYAMSHRALQSAREGK